MKKNGNKSLKRLKTEVLSYESQKEYKKALNCCKEIMKYYPNSTFGYEYYIKICTNSYTRLVYEGELKELKNFTLDSGFTYHLPLITYYFLLLLFLQVGVAVKA